MNKTFVDNFVTVANPEFLEFAENLDLSNINLSDDGTFDSLCHAVDKAGFSDDELNYIDEVIQFFYEDKGHFELITLSNLLDVDKNKFSEFCRSAYEDHSLSCYDLYADYIGDKTVEHFGHNFEKRKLYLEMDELLEVMSCM